MQEEYRPPFADGEGGQGEPMNHHPENPMPEYGTNAQPFDQPLREDGETAYFATIPVKAMVENMRNHGIPAHISYTAGTYVCNSIMYNMLYLIDKKYNGIRAGFIHVPFEGGQVVEKPNGTPFMSLEMIAKGLEYGIEAALTNETDVAKAMGETH